MPLLSVVLKETLLVPFLPMVLKVVEVALLTSCSVSWKETFTFFLPDLPMVLKEVSVPLSLTMSLTLLALPFSLMTLMLSTLMVLKGVLVHVHIAMVLKGLEGWS